MDKITVYFIEARTGCTCCSYENFMEGPYTDKDDAQAIIDKWSAGDENPLASQFAKYGWYHLETYEAELLPDGRIIVDDRVFASGITRSSLY
jgi:hypothetical protein